MDDTTFVPSLTYREPKAAIEWLTAAFGFELTMAIEDPENAANCHYEMNLDGRGRIMIGAEWADWTRSPNGVNGFNTSSTHVALATDIDAHCERARAAGATMLVEPTDEFYGDRVYRCKDLEGHHWTFSMPVRSVTLEEAEAAFGSPIFATEWP